MEGYLIAALAASLLLALILAGKLLLLRRALWELNRDFAERLKEDTNVGVDISTGDRYARRLAADINRQLKLLRQERLRYVRGDQELKNAVTGISHDLRTPLTAISGYLELLEREEVTPEQRKYLEIISGRVAVMRELSEELFRYSVILSEELSGQTERICLQSAVEECMAAYYGAFVEAGITPEIRLPEESIYGELNSGCLSRILSNIVSNAIKYSDGDFLLTLETEGDRSGKKASDAGGRIGVIRCRNRAAKLDTLKVEHLFDRFYTVEDASHSTGLGLAIARTLTEQLHGTITAEYLEESLHITLRFPIE